MEKNIILWGTAEGIDQRYKIFSKFNKNIIFIVLKNKPQSGFWYDIPAVTESEFEEKYNGELVIITDRNDNEAISFMKSKSVNYSLLQDYYNEIGSEFELEYMIGTPSDFNEILSLLKGNILTGTDIFGYKFYPILFKERLINISRSKEVPEKVNIRLKHVMWCGYYEDLLLVYNKSPMCIAEDGFIRSIEPHLGVESKFTIGMSAMIDCQGLYINAKVPSRVENILTSNWEISNEELGRSKRIIEKIIKNKITKYNHQPIREISVGIKGRKKVLVIDQVYGDRSIDLGLANDEIFKVMLSDAIAENPDADIVVKTHPDYRKGHFEKLVSHGNVYVITEGINPICLLEKMDKVYVCTSQMGFEALMCGKEVHTYGMPFYAGWGITIDKLKCERRNKRRSMEEVFHAAYIQCSTYISQKEERETDIESVIEEIIELREEYFDIKYNSTDNRIAQHNKIINEIVSNSQGEIYNGELLFKRNRERVLLCTDALNYNGGAMAALYAARALLMENYDVTLVTHYADKRMIDENLQYGFKILVVPSMKNNVIPSMMNLAEYYDIILANTLTQKHSAVNFIKVKPVFWWIHEPSLFYNNAVVKFVVDNYDDKIHIAAVSHIARDNFNASMLFSIENVMHYGIPDEAINDKESNKIIVALVGSIMPRKGTDIFVNAAKKNVISDNVEYWIIGSDMYAPENYLNEINLLIGDRKDIKLKGEYTREQMKAVMMCIDVIVVPSREDPLPITMTEALMNSSVAIMSDRIGNSIYIESKKNGFVFESENVDELADTISYVITNWDKMQSVKKEARKTYENIFTMEKFASNLKKELNTAKYKYYSNIYINKHISNKDTNCYSKKSLLQDIKVHDIISFDVFDTLLMRKTLYPDQIFEIMEDRAKKYGIDLLGFVHSRKIAEAPLWSGKFQFKDIYKRLQDMLRLSDDQRDWLMNLEINTEKSCIIPRHDMVDAFNYAKVQGKYIVLVTDMYHSKETITEFLEGIGITGYDEIFISAEYGHSKAGGLFLDVKKKCGEGTILHIGDNPNADVKPAMQNGIDTFLIESSRDILQKSPLGELIDHARNSNELSLLGLVASEVYNSPFSLDSNKIHISDVKNMIYSFIAPLATGFMLWIKNMIIAENYEGILFSARDCYVMKKMYEILINHEIANKTDLVYFYTSRKAAALICKDDQLIRKIYPDFNANEIINGGYNRSKCRENYIKYINSLNIKENGKYAMVDLSSRGTAQYFIQSIFPGDIKGLFLRRLEHRPFISVNADSYAYRKQFVVMYNAILESIFTSFEPSLESFDDNGKAIFADKPQSKENMVYIQKCHEAILEFFEEYVSNLYINNINIDFNFVFKIMQTFSSNSFIVDECIFDKIYIDDGERKEYIAKFLPEKKVIEVENKIMSNNQIITNKSIGYYHCFPFNDIPKNSKVIIYGMGEVGRHYLKQIRLTNYCDVEFATDGNWQNIDYVDVKMVPPEEIAKSNSIIVIANGNAGAANEIKSKLLSLGITESRIIWNDMIISEAMVTETLVGNTNKKLGHYHIFPFANIKKGEQIIIWGMGEVGRHYVKQLKKTGYASINFAVDSNWKNINNAPVNTFSTDILKSKVNAKIVIANGNAGVADKIIQQLKAWGYSDEQIVWNDLIVSESLVVQGATSSKSTVPAKVSLPEPKKVTSANSNAGKNGNVLIKAPIDKMNAVLEQVLKSQKDIEIVFSDK